MKKYACSIYCIYIAQSDAHKKKVTTIAKKLRSVML